MNEHECVSLKNLQNYNLKIQNTCRRDTIKHMDNDFTINVVIIVYEGMIGKDIFLNTKNMIILESHISCRLCHRPTLIHVSQLLTLLYVESRTCWSWRNSCMTH